MLKLGFFVSFRKLPMCVGESRNVGDGDNRGEEEGQSFRSELSDYLVGIIRPAPRPAMPLTAH